MQCIDCPNIYEEFEKLEEYSKLYNVNNRKYCMICYKKKIALIMEYIRKQQETKEYLRTHPPHSYKLKDFLNENISKEDLIGCIRFSGSDLFDKFNLDDMTRDEIYDYMSKNYCYKIWKDLLHWSGTSN
jgi:hypothetical protein